MDYVKMLAFAFIAALLIMLIKGVPELDTPDQRSIAGAEDRGGSREMRKETPCSVCGMTRLILPQIAEDFRSFPIRNSRPERKPCFFPILRRSHRSSRSGSANGPRHCWNRCARSSPTSGRMAHRMPIRRSGCIRPSWLTTGSRMGSAGLCSRAR